MRTLTRVIPLTLAAALIALFAVACSNGGGTDQTTSDQPTGQTDGGTDQTTSHQRTGQTDGGTDLTISDQRTGRTDGGASGDLVSAAPLDVLSASAESFQQEVESLQMEVEFSMDAGGFIVDSSAEMAFQAPDQMHMTMDLTGLGSFEMLVLGTDIYVDTPMQDWVVMPVDDLGLGEIGINSGAFQDSFNNHSIVDYAAIIESLGGEIEDLGEETVDGGTYQHYRGTVDFSTIAAAFGDTFEATEAMDLENTSGPLTFDAWVDPETFLPYVLTATGEFAFGVSAMAFDATMRFTDYNEPVVMPGPPKGAVPSNLLRNP